MKFMYSEGHGVAAVSGWVALAIPGRTVGTLRRRRLRRSYLPLRSVGPPGARRGQHAGDPEDLGFEVRVDNIARSDLYIAEEAFVCGTAAAVVVVGGTVVVVGSVVVGNVVAGTVVVVVGVWVVVVIGVPSGVVSTKPSEMWSAR